MAKVIRVDVVGCTGSGRSTVMRIIADSLKWHGIEATVHDPELSDMFALHQQRRIAELVADRLTVDIHQVNAVRPATGGGDGDAR